jgi:uncharacterized protein
MENRLETLRFEIDKLIKENQPENDKYFLLHFYSVSQFCALIALRRNLNPELAASCGMLHDIHPVLTGDYKNHGAKGAGQAEKLLKAMNAYTDNEISIITAAISRHSNKDITQDPYDEILQDADAMSHCLYNTGFPVSEKETDRLKKTLKELGCTETMNGISLVKHLINLYDISIKNGLLQLEDYHNESNEYFKNPIYAYCLDFTLDYGKKETIFDYPNQFMDLPDHEAEWWDKKRADSSGQISVRNSYPYERHGVSEISVLIRDYIDRPREALFEPFENDRWGLTDILRALDRRVGKRRLLEMKTEKIGVAKIISLRLNQENTNQDGIK